MAVIDKAATVENGTMISLKDLVTKEDWDKIIEKANTNVNTINRVLGNGVVDGVSIAKLNDYYTSNTTLISKMIQYLYNNSGKMTIEKFKDGVGYSKSDDEFRNNVSNGRSVKAIYGKMWIVKNDFIEMNPKIRNILDTKYNHIST